MAKRAGKIVGFFIERVATPEAIRRVLPSSQVIEDMKRGVLHGAEASEKLIASLVEEAAKAPDQKLYLTDEQGEYLLKAKAMVEEEHPDILKPIEEQFEKLLVETRDEEEDAGGSEKYH